MDRIAYDADAMQQYFAEFQRNFIISTMNPAQEAGFDPLDKTDRSDICPGTNLKLWDDVRVYDFQNARVICGATGDRTIFTTYRFDTSNGGHVVENWPVDSITDRAPADPEETPMPVIPPSP
jgi:hypothetical protein